MVNDTYFLFRCPTRKSALFLQLPKGILSVTPTIILECLSVY